MVTRKIFPFLFIQFFILGIGGAIVGPLIPILADLFKVRLDIIGSVLSFNAFGILLTTVFSGIIAERFGKKNILIIGSILLIISFSIIYFSGHFVFFTMGYIIFGLSLGMILVNSTSIINDVYKSNKSKTLLRAYTGYNLGTFIMPITISIILFININWKYLFLSVALLNIVLLILMMSFKIQGFENKKNGENFKSLFVVNNKLLSNSVIILCGAISFLHYGIAGAFAAWFTTYFKSLEVPLSSSSLILSLYLFIFGSGMFLKSFLLTRLNEKKVIQYSAILAFIFLFTSFFIDQLIFKVIFILFFGFSYSAIAALTIPIGIRQNSRYSGSITSIITGFGWMGVVVFQYIAGYLTENISADSIIYISLAGLFLMVIFTNLLIYNKKFIAE